MFKPPSIFFYRPVHCSAAFVLSFMLLVSYLSLLSSLFLAALWSSAGKGLTSCPSRMKFLCVLSLSHMVYLVLCGIWLYRFLIFGFFLTLISLIPLPSSCEKISHLCLSSDQRMGSDRLFCRWKFLLRWDSILTLKVENLILDGLMQTFCFQKTTVPILHCQSFFYNETVRRKL